MNGPYRSAAILYLEAGWQGPLPLPAVAKRDPPKGFTGAEGIWPSRADVQAWLDNGVADGNIALRLPDDVIGIDVDMYDGKAGRETLAELEARWGPLPDTWMSSSRDDGSGIRFYRVPAGRKWPSVPGPGIEIIQHGHRYAVVWPSVHPNGKRYEWKTLDRRRMDDGKVPYLVKLTFLPDRWVDGLASHTPTAGNASGWTDPDLDALVEHGIPAGVNQDETLRDVVWKLRRQEVGREATYAVWEKITRRTTLTRSNEPWIPLDFDRHWRGADAKLPRPLQEFDPPSRPSGLTSADNGQAERPSLLLTRSQLRDLPRPEPLITDTIDLRTVALVAGYWGTLKSFLAIDWAACIATGRPWMGREIKVGPVLYVAAEGAYGLGSRLDAWEAGWNQSRMIPDEMFSIYPRPINLSEAREVAELVAMADGRTFVVIDTLARCLVGGDEDRAKDMGMAVDALYKIRDATNGGTVLVLHHTGKDKTTTRGSSALEAGVDTVYKTEGDHRHVTLTRTKRKDGPVDDRHELVLNNRLESGTISVHIGADIPQNDQHLMSVFLSAYKITGVRRSELRTAAELAPASFSRSLQGLLSRGLIRNKGTDQHPFYVLGDAQ